MASWWQAMVATVSNWSAGIVTAFYADRVTGRVFENVQVWDHDERGMYRGHVEVRYLNGV